MHVSSIYHVHMAPQTAASDQMNRFLYVWDVNRAPLVWWGMVVSLLISSDLVPSTDVQTSLSPRTDHVFCADRVEPQRTTRPRDPIASSSLWHTVHVEAVPGTPLSRRRDGGHRATEGIGRRI